MLETFGREGPGPGVTAHYVAADASHGVVISETDDVVGGYRNIQNYTQWVEYETKVTRVESARPAAGRGRRPAGAELCRKRLPTEGSHAAASSP